MSRAGWVSRGIDGEKTHKKTLLTSSTMTRNLIALSIIEVGTYEWSPTRCWAEPIPRNYLSDPEKTNFKALILHGEAFKKKETKPKALFKGRGQRGRLWNYLDPQKRFQIPRNLPHLNSLQCRLYFRFHPQPCRRRDPNSGLELDWGLARGKISRSRVSEAEWQIFKKR